MRKLLVISLGVLMPLLLSAQDGAGDAFVRQLQPRDSILIADQLSYGVRLDGVPVDAAVMLPEIKEEQNASIEIVKPWQIDTLKRHKKAGTQDLEASITITSFDEGEFLLPDVPVAIAYADGHADTLLFKGQDVLYCTMPVDTATFVIHDIKGQMRYPLTFRELLPWLAGALLLAALVAAGIILWMRYRRRQQEAEHKDPPHIVALRKLDTYRGDKYWAAAHQKAFYSGVTDALREYISARYGVAAMEMTTAEIFAALKTSDLPADLKSELEDLFRRSDYVKFAKYVADDSENAAVLPLSVRFVTTTYQTDIKEENVL